MRLKFDSNFVESLGSKINRLLDTEECYEDEAEQKEYEVNKKLTVQYAKILTDQVKDLEQVLNQLYHSSNPSARMKELAENLEQFRQNNCSQSARTCQLTFEALTNDQSISDILRNSSVEEFGYLEQVVNICIDLTLCRDKRGISQEDANAEVVQIEAFAASFIKCFVRQHCTVYAELLKEIEETKEKPADEQDQNAENAQQPVAPAPAQEESKEEAKEE